MYDGWWGLKGMYVLNGWPYVEKCDFLQGAHNFVNWQQTESCQKLSSTQVKFSKSGQTITKEYSNVSIYLANCIKSCQIVNKPFRLCLGDWVDHNDQ